MFETLRGAPWTVRRLRDEMDRLFQGTLEGSWPADLMGRQGYPPINLWETDQAILAEVEVPGVAEGDLDVEVTGKAVTIRGRREIGRAKDAVYHRRERQIGEFQRTLQVPADIDASQVEAKLSDGVLSVTLPKAAAAKPRKIAVHGGA